MVFTVRSTSMTWRRGRRCASSDSSISTGPVARRSGSPISTASISSSSAATSPTSAASTVARAIVEEIRARGVAVLAVCGNTDRPEIEDYPPRRGDRPRPPGARVVGGVTFAGVSAGLPFGGTPYERTEEQFAAAAEDAALRWRSRAAPVTDRPGQPPAATRHRLRPHPRRPRRIDRDPRGRPAPSTRSRPLRTHPRVGRHRRPGQEPDRQPRPVVSGRVLRFTRRRRTNRDRVATPRGATRRGRSRPAVSATPGERRPPAVRAPAQLEHDRRRRPRPVSATVSSFASSAAASCSSGTSRRSRAGSRCVPQTSASSLKTRRHSAPPSAGARSQKL